MASVKTLKDLKEENRRKTNGFRKTSGGVYQTRGPKQEEAELEWNKKVGQKAYRQMDIETDRQSHR